jgi:hypothetical protein
VKNTSEKKKEKTNTSIGSSSSSSSKMDPVPINFTEYYKGLLLNIWFNITIHVVGYWVAE